MPPFSEHEIEAIISKISHELSKTAFACSALTRLTNGTTKFVFRGDLVQPVQNDGGNRDRSTTTVIIKYAAPFSALNKDFLIDASRAFYEESMLYALNDFPSSATATVKSPRLLLFIREANIQVLEDCPGAVDLKTFFVSPNVNDVLPAPVAACIGRSIGSWLRSFHDWSFSPNPALKNIGDNQPMRRLKYAITYDSYLKVLGNSFPALLEGHQETLEQVKHAITKEFEEKTSRDENWDKDWGFIHADFWTGNVLLPADPSQVAHHGADAKLLIIDWEFTQFGHRAFDVGQMVGDIYERKHFWGADGGPATIEGFIEGYGGLDDDLAFRIAIHAGVNMIGWYTRRAATAPLRFPLEDVAALMRLGRDWIVKGWNKDREYFESSPLACLFSR